MKTSTLRLICLFLAAMPMLATAQTNIKSAFDAIIKCPEAKITAESHTLDKDPSTNVKTAQSDVYGFSLPANKSKLLKNLLSAFEKDSYMAYSVNQGKYSQTDRAIMLAVGNGESDGIYVNEPDCKYIYALFMAPKSEDKNGIYRYAYGLNYNEHNGKITGKIIVTYATTLKYRQEQTYQRQLRTLRDLSDESTISTSPYESGVDSQQTWFDMLMSNLQGMNGATQQTKIALATRAYKLVRNISDYSDVTDQDKTTAREILKVMISDPHQYSEPILNKLLQQCLNGIK